MVFNGAMCPRPVECRIDGVLAHIDRRCKAQANTHTCANTHTHTHTDTHTHTHKQSQQAALLVLHLYKNTTFANGPVGQIHDNLGALLALQRIHKILVENAVLAARSQRLVPNVVLVVPGQRVQCRHCPSSVRFFPIFPVRHHPIFELLFLALVLVLVLGFKMIPLLLSWGGKRSSRRSLSHATVH